MVKRFNFREDIAYELNAYTVVTIITQQRY